MGPAPAVVDVDVDALGAPAVAPGAPRRAPRDRWVWVFPLVMLVAVVVLTSLRLSGSSVGVYHVLLYGADVRDEHVVANRPQAVRSDEWRVNTPLIVSQARLGFPRINRTIGTGQDMSVVIDVPYKEWSVAFRPQHWPFFLLPLEYAFALKWWLLGAVLAVSCYLLALEFLPGRYLVVSALALAMVWAPFVQWWYQTITIAPIAYSLLMLVVVLRLERARTRTRRWMLTGALAWLVVAFALVLYPPFQIPCATAVAVVYVAHLVGGSGRGARDVVRKIGPQVVVAGGLAATVIVLFAATRWSAISAIRHSVYPGRRTASAHGYGVVHLMAGPLQGQLQHLTTAGRYFTNQSEGSTFMFLWPYLLLPSVIIGLRERRRSRSVAYALLAVDLVLVIYGLRMLDLLPGVVVRGLLLGSILPSRLLIGFGVLGLLQLVLLIKLMAANRLPAAVIAVAGVGAFACQLAVHAVVRHSHPGFVSSTGLLVGLAAVIGVIVVLVLVRRPALAIFALAGLSLSAVAQVHPLYRGLDPLTSSRVVHEVARQSKLRPGGWAYLDDDQLLSVLVAAGAHSYSAVYSYPQLRTWRPFDPTTENQWIYNRYGYALFTEANIGGRFAIRSPDAYAVHYDPCAPPFAGLISHVMALRPLDDRCLVLDAKVDYPHRQFYLYSVQPREVQ